MREGKGTGQCAQRQAKQPSLQHCGWEPSCFPSLASASVAGTSARSMPTGMATGGSATHRAFECFWMFPLLALVRGASPLDVKLLLGATADCSL